MRNINLAEAKANLSKLSSGPRPERPYASHVVARLLIPVQAAHHNEMMSPAVTE